MRSFLKKQGELPIWRLAFRPFFLGGVAFGIISIAWWASFLAGVGPIPSTILSPMQWHGHEMLFGFGMAIVIGFVLTAVQTWTGIPGVKGTRLMFLWSIWLLARLSWLIPSNYSFWLAVVFDLFFLTLGVLYFMIPVIASKQWNNIYFAGVPLLILWVNGMYYLAVYNGDYIQQQLYLRGVVWLFAVIITVMGGRVIPNFSANKLGLKQPTIIPWLEFSCVFGLLYFFADTLAGGILGNNLTFVVSVIVTVLHVFRLYRWWLPGVSETPLLWSLYLSYSFIPLFVLASGVAQYMGWLDSDVLHLLSVGAISGMILSMIARVSLGHTGRVIESRQSITMALLLIASASLLRFYVVFHPEWRMALHSLSAIAWVLAFFIFFITYFKILTTKRIDGKDG